MAAKLPQRYLEKPARTVSQLEAGQSALIRFTDLVIDRDDLLVYLMPTAKLLSGGVGTVLVTRTDRGFSLTIRDPDLTFTPTVLKHQTG